MEGAETNEPYLTKEGCDEKQSISSITQMAHALCNNRLGDSTLVRIHWPKGKCQLLRDDVVLVDSPGIDVSESLDEWIDKHCLDADVFVLVANSESTLMNTVSKLSESSSFASQCRANDSILDFSIISNPAGTQNVSCLEFCGKDICHISYAFNPQSSVSM